MSTTNKSALTWNNLFRHMLAWLVASLSVGFLILLPVALLEIIQTPATLGHSGLFGFVFGMGLFMGAFYTMFSGLFILPGIFIGFKLPGKYRLAFSAAWGTASTLAIARLFHDRSQNLDFRFYLAVALAGLIAGLIYWRIAVRPPPRSA